MQGEKPTCRVAVYCRVARDDEDAPGAAIEQQRQILAEYARSLGYTETANYLDNGYSGLTADRPAFAMLNADIDAGQVDVVIAKDPSRFWRDIASGGQWYSRMDKKGVTVLCRDTPGFQKEMREMHTALAPMFKRKKKKHERHTVRTPPPPNGKKAR